MAGEKKKGKKKEKKEKISVDEYKLRKELRKKQSKEKALDMKVSQEVLMHHAEDIRIGGIEGGSTHSTLIVVDGKGKKLTEIKGPDTNHWTLGIDETAARISAMIEKAKVELGMEEATPMHCVALSLSGCEEEYTNQKLAKRLRRKFPQSAKGYVINSDTFGSLRTAMQGGGIVLISGTGSNSLLVNPDGLTYRCGGWGYMMGDEGSAYWIAHQACKYVFDDLDDFMKAPYPISYIWPCMRNYFGVGDRMAMLPHLYTKFDKSKIAMFAKEIAMGCERHDPLCVHLFEEAGRLLAQHIVALAYKAHNDLLLAEGGLQIVCVGSVFKSWKYMQKGFGREVYKTPLIEELTLLRLKTTSAVGACYMAAERLGVPLTAAYDEHAESFYRYRRETYIEPTNEIVSLSAVEYVTCKKQGLVETGNSDSL